MSRDLARAVLYMDRQLLARIDGIAAAGRRSRSQTLLILLERGIEASEGTKTSEPPRSNKIAG